MGRIFLISKSLASLYKEATSISSHELNYIKEHRVTPESQLLVGSYNATRKPKSPITPAAPKVTAPVGAAIPVDLLVEAPDPDPVAVEDPLVPVAVLAVVAPPVAVVFPPVVPVAVDPGCAAPFVQIGTLIDESV